MKEKIADYWNYRSATYHGEYADCMDEEIELWKQIFAEILPSGKKLRAVEVGTGPGLLAMALSGMGHDVTGIDLSEEMLKKASSNAEKRGLKIRFMPGDAEALPLESGEYDLILSKYLLWTLPSPEKFLGECNRLLTQNGMMIAIDGLWFNKSANESEKKDEKDTWSAYFEECYKDIKPHLPLGKDNTAEKIISLAEQHGFTEANWQGMKKYNAFLLKHDPKGYAASYSEPPYLISAKKL